MKQLYLLLVTLLVSLSAYAEKSGTCGDNLQWKLTDEGVLTITGTGKMQNWHWSKPSPWDAGKSVKQIIIGDGVTTIGDYAFWDCPSLTSVTIPNSVTTIGKEAFYKCSSLKSVTIPNSVRTIEEGAFYKCSSLTSVTIPNGVTTIGDYIFSDCRSLTSVTIPNSVTTIGVQAFSGCSSLTYVTIPNSVTSIATEAFNHTYAAKVIWLTNTPPIGYSDVDASIHYVPNTSYRELSNTKVYPSLSSIFEVGGIKYVPVSLSERTCDAIDCIYIGDANEVNIDKKVNYKGIDMIVRDINPYTFSRNKYITKANININGSIGFNAFGDCSSLTSVTIGDGVTTIGVSAFGDCSSLISVTIGNSVTTIGGYAFYGCRSLTSVTIPNSVRTIGKKAFSGCKNVKQITSEAVTPPNCALYAFEWVNTDECKLFVPKNSIDAYKKADGWKEFFLIEGTTTGIAEKSGTCGANLQWKLTDEGVLTITGTGEMQDWNDYSSPWYENESVKQVIIGDGVTTIGDWAFSYCRALTSITIPNSVTTIGDNAFESCSSLTSITIPNSVTTIGDYAFSYCRALTSVIISNSVTTIGERTFANCYSLTSVTIPSSVTRIEDGAFSDCGNVKQITSEAVTPPYCSRYAFDGVNRNECKLFVPKNSIDAYKRAYVWWHFFLIEGTTTGIKNNIYNKIDNVDVYTIDGIKRLSKASVNEINALPKGVYIINGKKIVIK